MRLRIPRKSAVKRGIWLQTSTGLGKQRLLRSINKTHMHQHPRERSSYPTRDWARLAWECLGVSGRGMGWQWPAAGSGSSAAAVLGGTVCWNKYLWRISPLPLPQSTGRKHIPTHQQKVWLKIYWAWPCPPEQDLVCKEACTSLLSSSIREQTEWKPQSQNTNQNNHIDHNFV